VWFTADVARRGGGPLTAVGLWVRGDLRRRWRSWVVLGLLAGVSVGLACAGIAGARRTAAAVAGYTRAAGFPDAAVLPNDLVFDEAKRAEVAALPEVEAMAEFMVPFELRVEDAEGFEGGLLPTTPGAQARMVGVLVDGRAPDPERADELVVNEAVRDQVGLGIGSTVTFRQDRVDPAKFPFPVPPRSAQPIEQPMHVVGITYAPDDEHEAVPSAGFYAKYRDQLIGVVNAFVDLRGGERDFDRFRDDVERLMGRRVHIERASDLFGVRQAQNASDVEHIGLLLFAVAVLVGAGALVGQAVVRAVSAGAADLETWRALGADRRLAVHALVAPATIVAGLGAATTIAVAVLLSPRFPIAWSRRIDLDIGFHADWAVLAPGAAGVAVAVIATAWASARFRVRSAGQPSHDTGSPRWLNVSSLPPVPMIGSRLVTDTGRGKRAVPVRSAIVGAIAGVLGVVACLTFRAGLSDTVNDPSRSGVVWDHVVTSGIGLMPDAAVDAIGDDPAVDRTLHATWGRAVPIVGKSTPTWGISASDRVVDLEMVAGHPPGGPDELVFASTTMDQMGLHIGERVTAGEDPARTVTVVGRALLPPSSHTSYDQGAWMTAEGLMASLPPEAERGDDFFQDYVLVRWKPDADIPAAVERLAAVGNGSFLSSPAELPESVASLRALRVLPLSLAVFLSLLAIATVAHALVTTVRRRRVDLAVLRSLGFTRRDARLAIAWQATLLAMVGVLVGVPCGIIAGRLLWRQIAEDFPVVYAPPLALLAILLIAPAAVAVANLLAAGPAHTATRTSPASVLRSE
jgi:hypothetical protein